MTENPNAFKHWIDEAVVTRIADALAAVGPFDRTAFVRACVEPLPGLELKERVRLIAEQLAAFLPSDFPTAVDQILATLPPGRETADDLSSGFEFWPYCQFVETYGSEHVEVSFHAMLELTQRFSAEFAVRPFLARDPAAMLARLSALTAHRNPHVRRWVSEGTRPRLPWGMRLQCFIDDPRPLLPLLAELRDDPEEYVRRSVANNLNDIAKDHPELVVDTCRTWWGASDASGDRMLRHALRTLVKDGHPGALALLGYGAPEVALLGFELAAPQTPIGGCVGFDVKLASTGDAPQRILLDYAVHHVRENGSRTAKVFKWTTRTLGPGEQITLTRAHAFTPVTTRRYYPGTHAVELLLNGRSLGLREFDLTVG